MKISILAVSNLGVEAITQAVGTKLAKKARATAACIAELGHHTQTQFQ